MSLIGILSQNRGIHPAIVLFNRWGALRTIGSAARTSVSDELIVQAFARIDRTALGLAIGILCGLAIFTATIVLLIRGGEVVGPNLALLGQFFFGYTVTLSGAFIGL